MFPNEPGGVVVAKELVYNPPPCVLGSGVGHHCDRQQYRRQLIILQFDNKAFPDAALTAVRNTVLPYILSNTIDA